MSSSNGTQDYQRQINDLTAFAAQNNYEVVKVFAEMVSGAKKNSERPALMDMIEFVKSNNAGKIIVTALDRLGRDTLQVLQAIELLSQNKISLHIQNYNIETLSPNGDINPILITILAEVARMERKTIRERIESGYKNHLANGGSVGRKVGYRKDAKIMVTQYSEDIKLLKKGYSLRNIQKITGTSLNTLQKVKQLI